MALTQEQCNAHLRNLKSQTEALKDTLSHLQKDEAFTSTPLGQTVISSSTHSIGALLNNTESLQQVSDTHFENERRKLEESKPNITTKFQEFGDSNQV
jgi:hypothetical protein